MMGRVIPGVNCARLVRLLPLLLMGAEALPLAAQSFVNPPTTVGSPNGVAFNVVAYDLRGNGKQDLIVANASSNPDGGVAVYLGNGSGGFATPVYYATNEQCWGVAVGDFNGDNVPDLAIIDNLGGSVNGNVSILLGNGDGTFQSPVSYPVGIGPVAVAVGSLRNNGTLDLVVTDQNPTSNVGSVSVLRGNGDGTFQTAVNYAAGQSPWGIVLGPFHGGNTLDIAVVNYVGGSRMQVLQGNGDGTFQAAVPYSFPSGNNGSREIAQGDFNRDGTPDLVIANTQSHNVTVFLGNGDGTFQAGVNYSGDAGASVQSTFQSAYDVTVGDFNGDGLEDLAVSMYSNGVSILLGNGDGTFQSPVGFPAMNNYDSQIPGYASNYVYGIAVGDFNGDHEPDLALTEQWVMGGTNYVSVLFNGLAASSTWLSSSQNPSTEGQSVTFTAHVTGSGNAPTGSVTFYDGTGSLGSQDMNGAGVATLNISSLAAGSHSITAVYPGDSVYAGSTSNVVMQNVGSVQPPVIDMEFGDSTIPVNGTTTLSFSITNENDSQVLTGIQFSDNLPSGLSVASPPGVAGSCGGGTITAVADTTSVSLAGATLPGGSSCGFSVNVTATKSGTLDNEVTVDSTNGGTGNTSEATLNVSFLQPQHTTALVIDAESGNITGITGGNAAGVASPNLDCDCVWDFARDAQGNFIVAGGESLYKVSADGTQSVFTLTGAPEEDSDPYYQSVAVDSQGNYVVVDAANDVILKSTPQGSVQAYYTYVSAQGGYDAYVRVDSSNNLILAEDECPDSCLLHLFEVPATAAGGSAAIQITVSSINGNDGPVPRTVGGMTLDAQGNYVITDWYNEEIFTIGAVGGAQPGKASVLFDDPDEVLCDPVGIFWDALSNSFFLVDDENEALYTLSADGSQLGVIFDFADLDDDEPYAVIVLDQAAAPPPPAPAPIPPLVLTSGALPGGFAYEAYDGGVSASGGVQPYTWSASGLPAGIGINPYTGEISGTTTQTGNFTAAITVTDSQPASVIAAFTMTISAPPPVTVSGGTLPATIVNTPLSLALSATGGGPPYTWALASGTPPPGLTLQSFGTLSGTPLVAGTYSFIARATDRFGGSATGGFTITILPPALNTTGGALPSGMVTIAYQPVTLTASGGTGPYTCSVSSGAPPAGLTLAGNCVISGTPTAATATGGASFGVTITDSETPPAAGTPKYTIAVAPYSTDLVLSAASVSFSLATPATTVPPGQAVQVQSSDVKTSIGYTVSVSPASATWLTVTGAGGTTPGSVTISLTNAALSLAASSNPYTATVTVTCSSGSCSGNAHTVGVSLLVTNAPPQLGVQTTQLSFNTLSSTPQATTQALGLTNSGGGSLGFASIKCAASWCTISGIPGSIGAGATVQLSVTADPSGLTSGYYYTNLAIVSSAGSANVPVTLFIAPNGTITLAPDGAQFTLPQGGAAVGNTSFLVSVSGTQAVAFTASVTPSAPWLTVTQSAGTASSTAPASINLVFDQTQVAALAVGTYYATVVVESTGAANSPQSFEVVVNVTSATTPAVPYPEPAGLVFVTQATQIPPAQTVTVNTGSPTPVSYQAAAATNDGGAWLSVSPAHGTTSAAAEGQGTVTVNPAGMKPGVYRGTVNYQFSAAAVRSVNITMIVQSATGTSQNPSTKEARPDSVGCTATQIVPTSTALVSNFAAPAAWPIELAVNLIDDCGSVINSGQIVATFSNGDPPLILGLTDTTGNYVSTWTPAHASTQITINARASTKGLPSTALQLSGAVTANNAPILADSSIANFYNPIGGAPLAPGTLVQITGQFLAGQTLNASTIPLPAALGGTSVIIGGVQAPVSMVSPGQVNAQVPFELPAGQPYEVIVNANNALTTPQSFQAGAASPGLSVLAGGYVRASHQDGTAISEAAPAKPGEIISIYLVGMGATTVPVASGQAGPSGTFAETVINPAITIGSERATVSFSGLIPGLVGVYQINLQVPADAGNGDLPLNISASDFASNSGLLPVHN